MSAAMKLDAERAAFEAAYARLNNSTPNGGWADFSDGRYCEEDVHDAWILWQAARTTPPQGELSALPELPDDPAGVCEVYVGKFEAYGVVVDRIECADGYSADQMRAYALAAITKIPEGG